MLSCSVQCIFAVKYSLENYLNSKGFMSYIYMLIKKAVDVKVKHLLLNAITGRVDIP